jgi:hypothetical protein
MLQTFMLCHISALYTFIIPTITIIPITVDFLQLEFTLRRSICDGEGPVLVHSLTEVRLSPMPWSCLPIHIAELSQEAAQAIRHPWEFSTRPSKVKLMNLAIC